MRKEKRLDILVNIRPSKILALPGASSAHLEKVVFLTPAQGPLTRLYSATSPEVEEKDLKAALLFPFAQPKAKSSLAKDRKLSGEFWALGELVRQKA
ncbi:MAG: hypothetical protein NXY57DRAFT_968644 [Lentinula lateritia]|nr:MAG: hypothetical protein NXY57DRAFT_968644 [Lentinula lateritia]